MLASQPFQKNVETSLFNSKENLSSLFDFSNYLNKLESYDTGNLKNLQQLPLLQQENIGVTFKRNLVKNLKDIKEFLAKVNLTNPVWFDGLILKELSKIDSEVKSTMKLLYDNIFQFFLSKAAKTYFNNYKFDFFDNDFLAEDDPLPEKIAKAIYFISYTYYLSYIRWLIRLKSVFKEYMDGSIITKQEFLKFFSSVKTDKFDSLYAQALCISSVFSPD